MSNPHFAQCPSCCQVEPVTAEGVMDDHEWIDMEYEAGYVGGYRVVGIPTGDCPGVGRKPRAPR